MILTCNACGKKFVVPDEAITASGRMVQCGSCGNKWKQFPINMLEKTQSISGLKKSVSKPKKTIQKTQKLKKINKKGINKPREISLYSPEYLAKKHGIKINDIKAPKKVLQNKNEKLTFGFYNSLIVFIFLVISIPRLLYFSQDFIISNFPISEFYLNYFFETMRNIFEIWKDLITY